MSTAVNYLPANRQNDTGPVARTCGLSRDDFERDYLIPRRPLIFTDATQEWGALSLWTPAFFQERFGKREVAVDGAGRHKIGEVIALLAASDSEQPAPYLHNLKIKHDFPELMSDVLPPIAYTSPNWLSGRFLTPWLQTKMQHLMPVRLFIGGNGATFPILHYDLHHTHAFLSQIYGRKEMILYPPEQTPFMYAKGWSMSEVNDVENPDLIRFPLFQQAVPTRLVLEPGETLFIPAGWWHTARILSPSITTSVNTVEASNWADFSRDFAVMVPRVLRPAYSIYMRMLGAYKKRFQTPPRR